MPRDQRSITAADIMPLDQYELIRADKKQEAIERKKLTRLAVGPYATVLFENWDSMWLQIQEMLRIEKGGDEQLADELALAFSSAVGTLLIPQAVRLTAAAAAKANCPKRRTSDAVIRSHSLSKRGIRPQCCGM